VEEAEPEAERYDSFARWAMAGLWLILVGVAYWLDGVRAVLFAVGAIVGVSAVWAVVWTSIQSSRSWLRRRQAMQAGLLAPLSLLPFHRRLAANFVTVLFEFPARLIDGI
jgi:hypothetical protein